MLQHLRRSFLAILFAMYSIASLSQVTATIVKDIAPGSQWSDPLFVVKYNGEIYFRADDQVHGRELWKSDGTEAGTTMVKDIYPGANDSDPEWLTVSNGILYFSAYTNSSGWELWRSDGTEAGTYLLKEITPGYNNTYNNTSPFHLVDVNGILYFAVSESNPVVANRGLWKSDGTAAGTVKVASTYVNSVSSGYITPTDLINVNGMLYFIGQWPSLPVSRTLWKSDGTEAGTVMVSTNTSRFPYGIQPAYLTAFNSEVYFAAKLDNQGGAALWKSDGTEAGTVMVKDMNLSSVDGGVQFLTNINNTLFFAGNTNNTNSELWKSDGTEAGTVLLKDINPGSSGSQPFGFAQHKGLVYFTANTADYGREIWKTDGTASGTTMVADLYPEAGASVGLNPSFKIMEPLNNILYFIGILDNGLGQELYKLNEIILPVVWEDISIDCKENLPHLYWKTASETHTKDFIVQASLDATNWINRDTFAAAGNSSASVAYQYTEINTGNNYRYYRVMQRDLDGNSTYSKVLNINCGKTTMRLSVFPNPANNSITLTGIDNRDINRIEIFDMAGRRVLISANKSAIVNISTLSKGLYTLKLVKRDAEVVSRKFIKQ